MSISATKIKCGCQLSALIISKRVRDVMIMIRRKQGKFHFHNKNKQANNPRIQYKYSIQFLHDLFDGIVRGNMITVVTNDLRSRDIIFLN